jgi:C4-dicarboxylate-specific signal transduction histidine kinase
LRQAQAELARVSRVTTMEQLAASIAHEVNQPLAAVVTSGNACLNWLSTSPPNLRKARDAVERIVRDGNRAGDVLKRVRALLKRAPLTKSVVSVNEVIREVLALAGGELRRHRVETSTELDFNLPSVMADFVQLQQVLLNLVMNAIESMTTITDRPRVLSIQSLLHDLAGRPAILVAVRDSGVGLSPEGIARVFEAFYTTKPEGMGMGLWICRSIIEAHGGQLTAQPNDGRGATFQFVLPAAAGRTA